MDNIFFNCPCKTCEQDDRCSDKDCEAFQEWFFKAWPLLREMYGVT